MPGREALSVIHRFGDEGPLGEAIAVAEFAQAEAADETFGVAGEQALELGTSPIHLDGTAHAWAADGAQCHVEFSMPSSNRTGETDPELLGAAAHLQQEVPVANPAFPQIDHSVEEHLEVGEVPTAGPTDGLIAPKGRVDVEISDTDVAHHDEGEILPQHCRLGLTVGAHQQDRALAGLRAGEPAPGDIETRHLRAAVGDCCVATAECRFTTIREREYHQGTAVVGYGAATGNDAAIRQQPHQQRARLHRSPSALILDGRIRLPLDRHGRDLVPFRGPAGTFPYLSAADVLEDRLSPLQARSLAGAVVLIGTSAIGLADLRSTPLDRVFPDVEVHATLVDALLETAARSDDSGGRPAFSSEPALKLGLTALGLLATGVILSLLMPLMGGCCWQ